MEAKKFYRLANTNTNQGLWYDMDGNFTGLIHTEFKFCLNHELPMPFDAEVVGYLSCTDTLETLYQWFPVEDIKQMEEHGYFITVYESTDYRFYHNHWVFNKVGAKFVERISLTKEGDISEILNLLEIFGKGSFNLSPSIELFFDGSGSLIDNDINEDIFEFSSIGELKQKIKKRL